MSQRVAVIGAGPSGLTSIKSCLDEVSLGETPEPGRSSIYRSLVVNTSKEMMCFSDFPMPADYPNYMLHSQLLQYLRLYAQHFDLLRHITFQTSVLTVRQRPDFSHSGQWEVVTENREGQEQRHIFDGVLVCSGHYTQPVSPLDQFPGHESFPGRCLHSWEYKDADAFRGKRVVVVGIGNSGGDIAVEISRAAEKTFLSTRKGAWVLSRMSSSGLPLDMTAISRLTVLLTSLLPRALVNWAAERTLNHRYDHRLYGLQPTHRLLEQKPLINDDLPGRILQGAVVLKPDLRGFQGSGLLFQDGTTEEDIDAVVFCTGYNGTFSFLPPSLCSGPGGDLNLYRYLYNTLPPRKTMLSKIETETKRNMKSYLCPRQAALHVDYIPYLDSLAEQVGVRPNILGLLLREPGVGLRVLLGPCTPYQYRLRGPGKWDGARQAILTQWERVAQPFRTRSTGPTTGLNSPAGLALSTTVGLGVEAAYIATDLGSTLILYCLHYGLGSLFFFVVKTSV
uniref:Flavin-containing monooxygenase n=1 Tax=Hucho hucho TaxID=62062 RepID=A0A4W5P1N6_9TELE